jgi:hypothetical protein
MAFLPSDRFQRILTDHFHDGSASRLIGGSWASARHGRCTAPVSITLKTSTPLRWRKLDRLPIVKVTEREAGQYMDMTVRCRKCRECGKARAALWATRATTEIIEARRTWFATLTLSPGEQFKALAQASTALRTQGKAFEEVSEDERSLALSAYPVAEWQKFIKRLRKGGAVVRTILVVEHHKSGLPHMHALIHERGEPVTHRQLSMQWRLGFSQFKLVAEGDERIASRYVCKYLIKSGGRLRASAGYGHLLATSDVSSASGVI